VTAIRVIATERVVRVVARGAAGVAAVDVEAPLTSTGGVTPTLGILPATPSSPGSLSAEDKAKLDALADPTLSDAVPQPLGNANAGTSTQAARGDHAHAHGAQGGGGLHSTATTTAAGFMSAADKTKLNGIAAGAQVNVPTNLGVGGTGDARTITSSTGLAAPLPLATPSTAGLLSSFYATLLHNFAEEVRDQVLAMLAAGSNITLTPGGVGASQTLAISATLSGGGGSGTVTSVGLSLPSGVFDVSGSPVTASGTLSGALKAQAENTVFAGPVSGADDSPTFRGLVPGDIPLLPVGSITGAAAQRLFGIGEFAPGDSTGTSIALGTGFAFAGNALNLSANLQGWHAIDPAGRVQSVNTRTGTVELTDADVPADVLEWNTTTKTAALTDRGVYVYATATGAKTYEFTTTAGGAAGEYHIRNDADSGDVTLTATGVTIKPPKGGTLVLEPGDTVTVKRVASNVLHVFGSTKAA
jgi:hypothetical protein